MFGKKRYIILALIITFSGIFTWFILYGDYPHQTPIRAKQVFYMNGN